MGIAVKHYEETYQKLFRSFHFSLTLHKKMKFSIQDFFSKCDQIRRKLRIWSHLLKKSLMENFNFVQCTVGLSVDYSQMCFGPSFFVQCESCAVNRVVYVLLDWYKLCYQQGKTNYLGPLLLTQIKLGMLFQHFLIHLESSLTAM